MQFVALHSMNIEFLRSRAYKTSSRGSWKKLFFFFPGVQLQCRKHSKEVPNFAEEKLRIRVFSTHIRFTELSLSRRKQNKESRSSGTWLRVLQNLSSRAGEVHKHLKHKALCCWLNRKLKQQRKKKSQQHRCQIPTTTRLPAKQQRQSKDWFTKERKGASLSVSVQNGLNRNAFHITTKELCKATEVPNTWRKRARQRDTGRQRQREAPPPPRQAIAEWPSGYTMSSTMIVKVTISIATPLALVFFVDRSLLLLLPCLFPRTKKTSSHDAEQERHTECVESSSTTKFSFGTWSSSSSSHGLELGLGESWHQTS